MNFLRSKNASNVHNIVEIMKNKLENREGKKWTLTEKQIKWLQRQISGQIRTSLFSSKTNTPGKIVLTCSIKFAPEEEQKQTPILEKTCQVEGTNKRCKEILNIESESLKNSKLLNMRCKNLSLDNYDTEDSSTVCLGDLKAIKDLITKDNE